MKKIQKIFLILLLAMLIIFILTNCVQAKVIDTSTYDPGTALKSDTSKIIDMAGTILAAIRNIGIILSVIILAIIGLKYMMGSLDEKANYKENMRPYIIGCFILASATTIPSLIYSIMN